MNQSSQNQSPSGLSIAALVTGILGMSIIPIILGIVDLNRIKSGTASPKGKGFDIAGIVLGGLGLVGWLVASIFGISISSYLLSFIR